MVPKWAKSSALDSLVCLGGLIRRCLDFGAWILVRTNHSKFTAGGGGKGQPALVTSRSTTTLSPHCGTPQRDGQSYQPNALADDW